MAKPTLKIEHSGNSAYAIHTKKGPAIYPTLGDLAVAIRTNKIEVSDGDWDYYTERDWLPVDHRDLHIAGIKV